MVSATSPQPLMAAASNSQEEMMGFLIQAIRQEIQKVLPQTSQNCQAGFNCGRLGHKSRENRAPRQNQNNRQQNPNTNQNHQNLRNHNQDRNANSSQQQSTLN